MGESFLEFIGSYLSTRTLYQRLKCELGN